MKRFVPFITIAILLLASLCTNAQETILYDFEEGVMPEGFTLINRDMLVPNQPEDSGYADTAWIVEDSGLLGSFAAVSVSWYVNDEGPADDWMILPKIEISESSVLSWTAISATSSGDFPDSYQVLVNTGQPTFESFQEEGAILLSIDPEEWQEPQDREVDLSEYAGQSVHLAFRNVTGSGTALIIDDIAVSNATLSSRSRVDNDAFGFELMPNPADAAGSQLRFELEKASPVQLQLRDLAGRLVHSQNLGYRSSGAHQVLLSVQGLASGTYLLSLQTAGKIGTTKLIIH